MVSSDSESKQRRLRGLRRAVVFCWIATTVAVLGSVGWAGSRIRSNVNDLMVPGPARQQMMTGVEDRVRKAFGSRLKGDANRAFRDLQPILLKDAKAVDAQAPAVAAAAVSSFKKLRDDLPGLFVSRGFQASAARPYQDQVTDILDSLSQIRAQEAPSVQGVPPSWDMDLMVLEDFHREAAALRSAK